LGTPEAHKAEFFHPASEKGSKLIFDEPRHPAFPFLLSCEKRFQLFGDDAVQQTLFWMSGCVLLRYGMHNPSGGMHVAN